MKTTRKARTAWVALFLLLVSATPGRAASTLSDALQKGLLEEEANQNYAAAAEAYQSVLAQFKEDRKIAATAGFRLGECYRKQGKVIEAMAQFDLVTREFADQTALAQLSQKYLTDARRPGATTAPAGQVGVGRPTPNPEEVRLVKEEIGLVEQLLREAEKRVQNGRASSAEVMQIRRQLLPLQRKLPENAEPDKQRALFNEEIALVKELLSQVGKQIEVGHATATDQIPLRRELLGLQRELLAVQEAPRFQTRLQRIVRQSESPEPTSDEESKVIASLEAMLQNSPDLTNDRSGGRTPLQSAAAKGQLAVARYLLDNGAEINATSRTAGQEDQTALHIAAQEGHKAMVELLLERGAKVDAREKYGRTPLHLAVDKGYTAVSKALIAKGADVNAKSSQSQSTPLHVAANNGNKSMIDLLLASNADINAQDISGMTPLMVAVGAKRPEIVQTLLDRHADVQLKSKDGSTALTMSVQQLTPSITDLLLNHDADPNVIGVKIQGGQRFERGQLNAASSLAPLHLAALNNDVPLIQSLLKHGAKTDLKDPLGRTALLLAPITEPGGAENSSAPASAAFKVLLASGADPNIADASGNTALLLAVSAGQKDAVEQLIEKGANLNAKAEDGRSPLLAAVKSERSDLTELLLAKGADPNQKGPSGYAPLHVAAGMHGNMEMARLLIGYKADVNARDDAGNAPLHYAAVHGAKATLKLLLEHGADRSATNGDGETPLTMLTGRKGVATSPWSWNDWGLPARLGWGPEQAGRIRTIPSSSVRSGQLPLAETVQQAAELLQEPSATSQPAPDAPVKK